MIQVYNHIISFLRATTSDQSQAEHSGHEYEVRRQVDIKQENNKYIYNQKKGKAIPLTGREGPEGCETSRLPHFIVNRLTDGGEVVSPTCQLPFTPRKISGTVIGFF
jgi:hypothetical protein